MVFWGKTFTVSKLDGENISVSDMGRKKYFESTYALENSFCKIKIMYSSEKKYFDTEKTLAPAPSPFNLNGCSLTCLFIYLVYAMLPE